MTDKTQTVANDMAQRQIFDSIETAETALAANAEKYEDWGEQTFAANGIIVDDDGQARLDPEVYGKDGFRVMLSKLTERGKGLKAVVLAPVPSLDLLLSSDEGKQFIQAVVDKELNHRAVKALRDAADVSTVVDQIPTSVEDYLASGREASGLMQAFDDHYKSINQTMSQAVTHWAKRRLIKTEIRKAMESKGYAEDVYPELENAGKNGSLFVMAIKLGISAAERAGQDPGIFTRWLESRDSKAYTPDEDTDELELDLTALTSAMLEDNDADEGEGDSEATGTDETTDESES